MYVANIPTLFSDPTGRWLQFVVLAVIALGVTIAENKNSGGNFLLQFVKNYAIATAVYYAAAWLGAPYVGRRQGTSIKI